MDVWQYITLGLAFILSAGYGLSFVKWPSINKPTETTTETSETIDNTGRIIFGRVVQLCEDLEILSDPEISAGLLRLRASIAEHDMPIGEDV